MKSKTLKALLTLMIMVLICTPVFAHPAEKVELEWDQTASALHVSIVHPVGNTSAHYISRIVVSVSGKVIEDVKLKSQSDPKMFKETFVIKDAPKGAKVEVETTCNVYGKRKNSITI